MKRRQFNRVAVALVVAAGAIGIVRAEVKEKEEKDVQAAKTTESFDSNKVGELPAGWLAGCTGPGAAKWTVEADGSAPSKPNVLKQSGEGRFPWCVKQGVKISDGFVEVRFKPLAGKEDQAGGLIWRWQDGDNYYITRANALEDNVTIYHTVKGKRVSFKNAGVKVSPNEWHTLRVDFDDNRFKVTLDGSVVIEATDDTFKDAGAVGVWTKADSVTIFDDFGYGSCEDKDDDEQEVELKDCPAAVQKTIKEKAGDAAIQEIEKEDEDGKTVYDVEIKKDGKEREFSVAADGKFLGWEEDDKDDAKK
ncbi:MAG TPA: hypothetical protein PKM57_16985 [Kiritimatiellia bacterium]|nr:hypothetical protein [Kiritimatiellia bacterium]HPS08771.1 hypothetical protein [Kiritimatiellia bacterium]